MMACAKDAAPEMTFQRFISVAAKKNQALTASEDRPLRKTLLQRHVWHKLQRTFLHNPANAPYLRAAVCEVELMDSGELSQTHHATSSA
eukprot:m.131543 g.131543  ORF g.131543 m.131543 type:complete len:89 (+) comp13917_c0_seq1:265-531(+)